jgi:hypothetical protein
MFQPAASGLRARLAVANSSSLRHLAGDRVGLVRDAQRRTERILRRAVANGRAVQLGGEADQIAGYHGQPFVRVGDLQRVRLRLSWIR